MVLTHSISSGAQRTFNYPKEFVTLPEYTAHRGVLVTVIRPATDEEVDPDMQPMYLIWAADGWTGYAWEDELDTPEPL